MGVGEEEWDEVMGWGRGFPGGGREGLGWEDADTVRTEGWGTQTESQWWLQS